MRRAIPILAALALLAGCGGPSAEQKYVDAVNKAQDTHGQKISALATPEPTDDTFSRQAAEVRGLISDLRSIKDVPEKARAQHGQLIAALEQTVQAIESKGDLDLPMQQVRAAITAINGSV